MKHLSNKTSTKAMTEEKQKTLILNDLKSLQNRMNAVIHRTKSGKERTRMTAENIALMWAIDQLDNKKPTKEQQTAYNLMMEIKDDFSNMMDRSMKKNRIHKPS